MTQHRDKITPKLPKEKIKPGKKFRIKIYTHVMNSYIAIVLISQEGDTALRTLSYLGEESTFTIGDIVKDMMNQSSLISFKNDSIVDGGFYFNDDPVSIERLKPSYYSETITIGDDKYALALNWHTPLH